MEKMYVIKIYVDKNAPHVSMELLEKLSESFMSICEVFTSEGYIAVEIEEEEVEDVKEV